MQKALRTPAALARLLALWLLVALTVGCGDHQQDYLYTQSVTPNPITPPPLSGRMVVANYDTDNFLVFDLKDVVDGQVNNIAPKRVIAGPDTTKNMELEAAGSDAVWCTDDLGNLFLFDDIDTNNGVATRALDPNSITYSISYDQGRDILYSDSNNGDPQVAVFDSALTLPDGSVPTRALTGFEGPVETIALDAKADRLFVIVGSGPNTHNLHVFNNASGLNGGIAGINHNVTSFELSHPTYGATYDPTNDRLWFGQYADLNNDVDSFYFLVNASALGATTTVNVVNTSATGEWFWDTLYDTVTGRLFVTNGDYEGQVSGTVGIYGIPGAIPQGNGSHDPDTSIRGANTLISDVSGIAILR